MQQDLVRGLQVAGQEAARRAAGKVLDRIQWPAESAEQAVGVQRLVEVLA